MTDRKRTARKPLMTCRKRRDDVKTGMRFQLLRQMRFQLLRQMRFQLLRQRSRYCGNSLDETCLRAGWHPALRWPESVGWRLSGTWEHRLRCKQRSSSGRTIRVRVRMRSRGAEQLVVAMKSPKRDGAKGLCYGARLKCAYNSCADGSTSNGRSL